MQGLQVRTGSVGVSTYNSTSSWASRCDGSAAAAKERRRSEKARRTARFRFWAWSALAVANGFAAVVLMSELHPYIPGFWLATGLTVWSTCNAVVVAAERRSFE